MTELLEREDLLAELERGAPATPIAAVGVVRVAACLSSPVARSRSFASSRR
jgi:hypothetical protein